MKRPKGQVIKHSVVGKLQLIRLRYDVIILQYIYNQNTIN